MSTAHESLKYVAQVLEEHMPLMSLDDFSPLESKEQRDNLRSLVDQRMTLLLDQVLKLKRYRNTIATISILPDDILAQIFFEYVLLSGPWNGRWTKISFVCRRWADLCMNNPRFWSFVSNTYESHGSVWVHRSQEHPVSCKLELFGDDSYSDHYLFLTCLHRIRKLDVAGKGPKLDALFGLAGSEPAGLAILEDLSVRSYANERWIMPNFLFQDVASRYRSLALSDVAFSSIDHFNSLENLTKLSLDSEGSNSMEVVPTMKDLSHLLERSPRMQELKICRYIRQSDDTVDNIFRPVALPQLKSFVLDLEMRMMEHIFDNLAIPRSTKLGLWLNRVSQAQQSTMLRVLSRHFRFSDAPKLRCAGFRYASPKPGPGRLSSFYFNAHTEIIDLEPGIPGGDVQFSLLVYPRSVKQWHRLLRGLFRILPFDSSGLSLDVTQIMEPHVTRYSWRTIFEEIYIPLDLRIGGNEAMIPMLDGLVSALKARGSPRSSRYKKRHPSPPKLHNLRIVAALDPGKWSREVDRSLVETQQLERYDRLVHWLTCYRDIDVLGKPYGEKVTMITFERIEGTVAVYRSTDKLFEVCDILLLGGTVWDPIEMAKRRRSGARWLRQFRIDAGEEVSDEELEPEPDEPVIETVLSDTQASATREMSSQLPGELEHWNSDDFTFILL
ncbi:hypothetical protein C8J56DRAFT_948986 [Mycena floridula]|nr:hypothetical protein C8J56DRAFT_948986 [Mycena floridula]